MRPSFMLPLGMKIKSSGSESACWLVGALNATLFFCLFCFSLVNCFKVNLYSSLDTKFVVSLCFKCRSNAGQEICGKGEEKVIR